MEKTNKLEGILRFAVASKDGIAVNQHFGHAELFYIYDYFNGKVSFHGIRPASKYCTGDSEENTTKLCGITDMMSDCDGVIVLRIGDVPAKALLTCNIKVYISADRIINAVQDAALDMQKVTQKVTR